MNRTANIVKILCPLKFPVLQCVNLFMKFGIYHPLDPFPMSVEWLISCLFMCAGGFFHVVLDTELSKDHPALLVDVDGEEDHSVCSQPEVGGGVCM